MNKLYKYTGSVSSLSYHKITPDSLPWVDLFLYDMNDDDKAPVRIEATGGLADYINAIECTDAEERYLTANWYYDSNLHLFRIEILSTEPGKPAALVQARKAKISPYYHDKLDALLDRYARRLSDYYNAYYRNESACPSILVCGGSNFPVRKKQKQNARRESLWQEYKEIDAILDKIRSVGTGAVDLTDPHARELLQDRLQQEQNALDYCKAANAYYRKHKTLRGYASLTDEQADAITDPEAFSIKLYGKPYGDFELSSLRGKIKRVQARLADLDKLQAAAQQPDNATKFDGGEIVRNAEENRLQILFDEIPDADTRDALKSNGFRWSPRNKAWQRQLTQNAEYAARRVLDL